MKLKPAEKKLDPPGISVLEGGTPKDAANQMRTKFNENTKLGKSASTIGTATEKSIKDAGFNVIPVPSVAFPNHHRVTHPDGVNGFSAENLLNLSKAFKNTTGN